MVGIWNANRHFQLNMCIRHHSFKKIEKEKIGSPSKREECKYLLHGTIAGLATLRHDFCFLMAHEISCM